MTAKIPSTPGAASDLARCLRRLGAAALLAVVAFTGPANAEDRRIRFPSTGDVVALRMIPSKAITVQTNVDFGDVVVGDPDIVDVSPLTNNSLYMLARKNGRTNVLFYDSQKKLVGMIDVEVALDIGELKKALRTALPGAKVTASLINGRIRLGGTVADGVSLRTALDIASQFGSESVINTIRVTDAQQVMLQVRFLEAKRDAGRELGIGWAGGDTATGGEGVVIGVGGRGLPSGAAPFGTLISHILDAGVPIDVVVKALETKNLARRLAEPNLVAQSGETASFLAGGEFPIAVPASANQGTTVQYKEYGIRLTFTPIVLDDGLINLELEPEVSEIDTSLPVQVNGANAPALITRRTKTTVELHDGQSFAIAGLLQSTNVRTQDQIPWLGQVPVLGALFRSASYQKRETNLVVIITPHIVRPARPGEPLHSPLDKDMPSNDAEFFLIGAMEVTDETLRGYARGTGVTGAYGHIIDLDDGGPMSSRRDRLLRTSSAMALAAAVAGCSGYLDHNDTVSAAAGDAVDANVAIHTIDPWPLASSRTEYLSNGHSGAASAGATTATSSAATPAAAGATPAGAGQSAQGE